MAIVKKVYMSRNFGVAEGKSTCELGQHLHLLEGVWALQVFLPLLKSEYFIKRYSKFLIHNTSSDYPSLALRPVSPPGCCCPSTSSHFSAGITLEWAHLPLAFDSIHLEQEKGNRMYVHMLLSAGSLIGWLPLPRQLILRVLMDWAEGHHSFVFMIMWPWDENLSSAGLHWYNV